MSNKKDNLITELKIQNQKLKELLREVIPLVRERTYYLSDGDCKGKINLFIKDIEEAIK